MSAPGTLERRYGPRRGWQILTWRRRWLVWPGAAAAAACRVTQFYGAAAATVTLTVLTSLGAVALVLLFPTARRVLALLAVPAYPLVFGIVYLHPQPPWLAVSLTGLYLPPLAAAALIAASARRSRRHAAGAVRGAGSAA